MDDTELIQNLVDIVEELMPGVGDCVVDIGRLNDTLMAADRRLREESSDEEG